MPNQETIAVIMCFVGSLLTGMAGWWDSHEPFDPKKFMGNVWRSLFAVTTYALAVQSGAIPATGAAPWLTALTYGMGIEGIGNKVQGAIAPTGPSVSDQIAELKAMIESMKNPPGATP
jgi:hypothetical protein